MSSFKDYFLDYFESAWLQGNFPTSLLMQPNGYVLVYKLTSELQRENNESRTKPSKKYVELEKRRQNLMTEYEWETFTFILLDKNGVHYSKAKKRRGDH